VGVIDQEIFTALGKAPYHIEFYIEDLDTTLFLEKDSLSQFSDCTFASTEIVHQT